MLPPQAESLNFNSVLVIIYIALDWVPLVCISPIYHSSPDTEFDLLTERGTSFNVAKLLPRGEDKEAKKKPDHQWKEKQKLLFSSDKLVY